jgi:hypothetical protein
MNRHRSHQLEVGDPHAPAGSDNDGLSGSATLDVLVQLLAAILESRSPGAASRNTAPQPMLTVAQTAAILGASRTTIIRKADAGELPCVIVSRGQKQKMRRFPKSLIYDLALRAGGLAETDLRQLTTHWLESIADRSVGP